MALSTAELLAYVGNCARAKTSEDNTDNNIIFIGFIRFNVNRRRLTKYNVIEFS
jgi:hypothetical protein